jgi:hypothetical protein
MDVVVSMEKVWIREKTKALPFDYGRSCSDEIDVCVFITFAALGMSFGCLWEEGLIIASGRFIFEQRLSLGQCQIDGSLIRHDAFGMEEKYRDYVSVILAVSGRY